MASALPLGDLARGFNLLSGRNKVGLMMGLAMLVAIGVGSWLWSMNPEYRLLYSNVSDRDGGAIVAALNQANVPYKVAEGGNSILVPARMVHDTRLRLASQGLPRGGVVGFELMENQKLGATQFQEQVNYQRALEGELARSIQTLSAVASARVHLAIPKPSVFLREQQKPSASVIVNLHAGRSLERAQIAGIAHLVSSSVAELPLKAVSVLDQHGNLLSAPQSGGSGLDGNQLAYVSGIEAATIKRITDILEPILGRSNLRVQVTAEVDFSQSESTAETYAPNQKPESAVVRSEQRSESSEPAGTSSTPQGIPGAASNQPNPLVTTPIAAATSQQASAATKKESTVNYEVDKTVRHVKSPVGVVKRLSAAVVVNHRKVAGPKPAFQPLTEAEMAQINSLAKEAMGFSQQRGDSISVANAAFSVEEREPAVEVPLWKQPENIALAMDAGKVLAAVVVILYILLGILKPVLRALAEAPALAPAQAALPETVGEQAGADHVKRLQQARQLAKSDPKVVANVVKTWVAADE
jgi:flagellar M-ring protein FliF